MNRLLIFFFCCWAQVAAVAQVPDFISVRKPNGRTVENFMAGFPIAFYTKGGTRLAGEIAYIRHDSIAVREYIVRRVMTNLGVYVLDTAGSLLHAISFHHIGSIYIGQKQNFLLRRTDDLLLAGGAGYLLLNLLNGAYFEQPAFGEKNLRRLATGAGAVALGAVWHRLFGPKPYTTRRHRILYINMQPTASPM